MTLHRKIGGIHWLRLGRIRIAFCITKRKPQYLHGISLSPYETALAQELALVAEKDHKRRISTYTEVEYNMFQF